MTKPLIFDVDENGIAVVTLDLPGASMNIITPEVATALDDAFEKILTDDTIVGAVLTTGKKDFMAGADLGMIQGLIARKDKLGAEGLYKEVFALNARLRKLETGGHSAKGLMKGEAHAKPIVAAVRGLTLGGGFEIALACHARFCTPDAKFGLPEVKVGLLPGGGGTQRLSRMIGLQNSLQYLTTGKNIKAQQAKEMGVVDEIYGDDLLLEEAKAWILKNLKVVNPWDRKGFKYPGGGGAMHPAAVQLFIGANAIARGQSYGNYPAVKAILSAVYEGSNLPFDKAIQVEAKYFTTLLLDPAANAMIRTLFINKLAAEKGARRPKKEPEAEINKVGILGAGLMGAGIAHDTAKAGIEVVLLDRDLDAAARGKAYTERLVKKAVERGRMDTDKAEAMLARIHPTTSYDDLAGCDLVVEAVFESAEIKADVTKKTEAVTGPDTVFGSNTSTLPITGLQKNWSKPDNFIGLHFFSPVERMPLLEIIMGKETGDKALATALDYARKIRKTPIVVNDSRGFYTSRCVMTYPDEAGYMLNEGVSPVLIENCGRQAGYPMGPLQLSDSVNIDLMVKVARQTIADLGDDYQPGPIYDIAVKMVEEFERLGMKNAKGFYDYDEGSPKPKQLWPGLADAYPTGEEAPDPQEIKDRLLYRQVIECVKCLDEGVLTNPADGDLGAIFGWGFPPFTGGPFSFIDSIGAKAFVERCYELAERYGERFEAPESLKKMARAEREFYRDVVRKDAA